MKDLVIRLFRQYREVLLYLFFGGLTTLVNIVSYWVLTDLAGIHYLWGTAWAWVLSVIFAYVTNRKFVFQSTASGFRPVLREILMFFGCRALSFAVDLGMMAVSVEWLHMNDLLAKILANIVVIILNYLFSKILIFRKPGGGSQAR